MSIRGLYRYYGYCCFCYYCCFLCLSTLAFTALPHSMPTAHDDEAASLLSFKWSVTLDPSNLLSSWSPSTHHCRWFGVTCDRATGKVVGLNVTGSLTPSAKMGAPGESVVGFNGDTSFIAGTLSPSIGNLTQLRVLSLPHNLFAGVIPAELGGLGRLEVVELQGNNFTGDIPSEINGLTSLRLLNLSYNALSGVIPGNLIGSGMRIRVLDLSNNQLSGEIPVVKLRNGCKFLVHLKLSDNFLVGSIPAEIGSCTNLRTLLLDGNILEDRIPPEIGKISELRVFDVSRNSLTDRIPRELANCQNLVVLVLTILVDYNGASSTGIFRGEYNAFEGGVPSEILMVPTLQIFWAPRANLRGQLTGNWTDSCSLRVVSLGNNYMEGAIPENIKLCKNLTFLDLGSNRFSGSLPSQLQLPCMVYFNVSQNSLSGMISEIKMGDCNLVGNLYEQKLNYLSDEDVEFSYSTTQTWLTSISAHQGVVEHGDVIISHDFSWNDFSGPLPLFSLAQLKGSASFRLMLNNNNINASISGALFLNCSNVKSFSVNLSSNMISGELYQSPLLGCSQLTGFEAGLNQIEGSIPTAIGKLVMLQRLDLGGNKLSGSLPEQLGSLKNLKRALFGGNNLTGEIPTQLGHLDSMVMLDLSHNHLTGSIPPSLSNAINLEILLLDHNKLSGEIPVSFSTLSHLTELDVSFNNLSGHIPPLRYQYDCDSFKGNAYLHSCPDTFSVPPTGLPFPLEVHKKSDRKKMKSLVIASAISVSVLVLVIVSVVLALTIGHRKFGKVTSLARRVVVTFADAPVELTYENVVRATENFSLRNLIGTGGFGSTYKAELLPGYLVAVKRLSIGRFQGIQQFEAEIRTLGRVRHSNLVTLIGYYVGDTEMFLIYNYLSGGNLETFIHDRSAKDGRWPVVHKIAVDIAQALAYLHYTCVPRIVHRDIKPSNILLDEELKAYLSDFGLARLLEVSQTHATTDVAGTFGYVAPEYATTCRVSDKADVYSFGVVLLELMSGKKCLDPSFCSYGNGFNIVAWASLLLDEGRSSELFSPELWESGKEEHLLKILRLALACTMESLTVRPSMRQVLDKLKQLES